MFNGRATLRIPLKEVNPTHQSPKLALLCLVCAFSACNNKDISHREQPQTTQGSIQTPNTDTRILSIMHAKNQEEIRIGRLAKERGTTEAVRNFGSQLVNDHSANDEKVLSTARNANISLLSIDDTNRLIMREKGRGNDPMPNVLADLQARTGTDFDREFAIKMHQGHAEVIMLLDQARPNIQSSSIRDLVNQTLPALRKHQQMAMDIEH